MTRTSKPLAIRALSLALFLAGCAGHVDYVASDAGPSTGGAVFAGEGGSSGVLPGAEPGTAGRAGTPSVAITPSPTPSSGGSGGIPVGGGPSHGGSPSAGAPSYGGATGGGATGGGATGGSASFPPCSVETKGSACTNEGASCLKTCGPDHVGQKSETCIGGVDAEGPCQFDLSNGVNWQCYSLAAAPACGASTMADTPCTIPQCMPCQGIYADDTGAQKYGACVCSVSGKWSCASITNWPMVP